MQANVSAFPGISRIVRIDDIEQELVVRVDEREVTYDSNELDELMLSYAVTGTR